MSNDLRIYAIGQEKTKTRWEVAFRDGSGRHILADSCYVNTELGVFVFEDTWVFRPDNGTPTSSRITVAFVPIEATNCVQMSADKASVDGPGDNG